MGHRQVDLFKSLESSDQKVIVLISRSVLIILTGLSFYLMMDWFPRTPEEAKFVSLLKYTTAVGFNIYGCFQLGRLYRLKNYEKTMSVLNKEREKLLLKLNLPNQSLE